MVTQKEDFFRAWNSCLHHVTSLSLAHIHRGQWLCLNIHKGFLAKKGSPHTSLSLVLN